MEEIKDTLERSSDISSNISSSFVEPINCSQVCSICNTHYKLKNKYLGNKLPLCNKCRSTNDSHFNCSYCRHKINFYESKIPEYFLKGKRPYCLHCYQWFFLDDANRECSICGTPFTSNTSNNSKYVLCYKCKKGCNKCGEKNPELLQIATNPIFIKKYSNYTPYCYCRICTSRTTVQHRKK